MSLSSKVARGIYETLQGLISFLPAEWSFLKRAFYRMYGAKIGKKVVFSKGAIVEGPRHLQIGSNTWIDRNCVLICGPVEEKGRNLSRKRKDGDIEEGKLVIGENCHLAIGVVVQAHGGVRIGSNSGFASYAVVYSLSHHYRSSVPGAEGKVFHFSPRAAPEDQALISSPVMMGDGAALGLHAVVLPGTNLGNHVWVASGSVVRGTFGDRVVLAGDPAVEVKKL